MTASPIKTLVEEYLLHETAYDETFTRERDARPSYQVLIDKILDLSSDELRFRLMELVMPVEDTLIDGIEPEFTMPAMPIPAPPALPSGRACRAGRRRITTPARWR